MNDHLTNELGWMLDEVAEDAGGAARDPAVGRRDAAGPLRRASRRDEAERQAAGAVRPAVDQPQHRRVLRPDETPGSRP